jgi:hypothetical protein
MLAQRRTIRAEVAAKMFIAYESGRSTAKSAAVCGRATGTAAGIAAVVRERRRRKIINTTMTTFTASTLNFT